MKMRRSHPWIYRPNKGFTLIEVLVVIAIAGLIAALLMTVVGAMIRNSNIQRAMSERDQLMTALDAYRAKYGHYPPGNAAGTANLNQLYYELLGTQPNANATGFETLDGASQISLSAMQNTFGVSAFVNCQKGTGDDAVPAQTFLSGLKAGQIAGNGQWNIIVTAANSDAGYAPLPGVYSSTGHPANPWCYLYPGINNPNGYDLWVILSVGNKSDLICNWSKAVQYR